MESKTFELLKFSVCRVTGKVETVIRYDHGHGTMLDARVHEDEQRAFGYVDQWRKDFIKHKLEVFVRHKKILFEKGDRSFYQHSEKLASLDKCWKAVIWCQDVSFDEICRVIPLLEPHMINILPQPSNPSHSGSVAEMQAILSFCTPKQQTG